MTYVVGHWVVGAYPQPLDAEYPTRDEAIAACKHIDQFVVKGTLEGGVESDVEGEGVAMLYFPLADPERVLAR